MNLQDRMEMLANEYTHTSWFRMDGDCVCMDGAFNLSQLQLLVDHIKEHGYKEDE